MATLNLVYKTPVRGMFAGRKIRIKGRGINKSVGRFDIHLESRSPGRPYQCIPLLIAARFREQCIVRNTFAGHWQSEERNGGLPFRYEQPFTIDVECKPHAFTISINGSHFCDYVHRLPYDNINFVSVNGDVEIQGVYFNEPPKFCGEDEWWSNELTMAEKVVYETAIRDMCVGWRTKIQGRTSQCSNGFDIDLKGRNPCDGGRITIPLHISVRFGEGYIVRNSLTECGWGLKEKDGGMPISRGQSFTIELECKQEVFSIIINGCHFSDFKHRLSFETINNMMVTGNVEVCDVSFSGNCSSGGCEIWPAVKPNVHEVAVISMFVGRLITVDGSTTACTNSFDIDLVHKSPSGEIRFTIPLHIRFHFVEERIIINTLTDCGWGKEESRDGIPLKKGESFSVVIECKKSEFKISIDGVRFCDYKHRLPYETITHVRIKGDIPYRQVTLDEVKG